MHLELPREPSTSVGDLVITKTKAKAKAKPTRFETKSGKNPFLSLSIWVHIAVIFYALNNPNLFTPTIPETPSHNIAREYTRTSQQEAMRERVDDMEAVKKMVDALANKYDAEAKLSEPEKILVDEYAATLPTPDVMPTPDASLESMQELFARSEYLLQEIYALKDEVLQEKLSALADNSDAAEVTQGSDNTADQDREENDTVSTGAERLAVMTNAELLQATTQNQLAARELLDTLIQSKAVQEQGHRLTSTEQGGDGGGAHGAGQEFDPSSALSVEHHFSTLAQGSVGDVSQAMRTFYAGSKGGVYNAPEEVAPPLQAPTMASSEGFAFARKLHNSGARADWVILNAWYFMGPFPNQQRVNIHTRFPPEISIDLDALYIGDSNRLLAWQYIQYDHLPIIPPDFTDYSVYYAYTEIMSASAQDVWLAVGSDDQSKLWVNKLLVWQSDDQERVWQRAQGYRKVSLKQGRNEFLFRLENGVERAAFSVSLASVKQ